MRTTCVGVSLCALIFGGFVASACRAADEKQTIHVPEGFTVELVADSTLVVHPTFATFDDRGRLFVCENAGVNMRANELEENLPNSIRLLEDTDDDGRFDKSTVFADKMTFPMGGAWHDGALYVASPPSIWRLEDTTGDGVADQRDVIVNKFGFSGNAASIHGCFFGPDGRLYWCDGYHGHEFKDEAGKITSQRKGSYLFSCKPDGSDVRRLCGGGMDNPVEVDFTNEGEVLGTVNIFLTRPRVDCLVYWQHGGAYPHREQVLSEIKITGDVLGSIHQFGHVAISGTLRYRSGAMDPRWRDNMFATFFNGGKVVRLEIEREGATFGVAQREFLACDNRDFHPTDIAEDADGSLLVVDTGGWFYLGCPTSQHAKPEIHGAIYRVRRTDVKSQPDPWGKRIGWPKLTNSELVGLLNDARFKVRERAITECALRGESIIAKLDETIQRSDVRQRQNAVWALTRIIGQSDPAASLGNARSAIRRALDDEHPDICLTACRSLATYPDRAALPRLLEILQSGEPAQRREAATALGRLEDAQAVPAILTALGRDVSRTEEHALIYALIEINDPRTTRTALAAENPNTQRGAMIGLDQMEGGHLTAHDVVALASSNDPRLQRAAGQAFSRHKDWTYRAADVLARLLAQPEAAQRNEVVINRLVQTYISIPAVGETIGRVLEESQTSPEMRDLVLTAISHGNRAPLHASWTTPFARFLESDEPQTVQLALAALAALKTDHFKERLERIGGDEQRPTLLRVSALQVASGQRAVLSDAAFDLLAGLLESGGPSESLRAAQKLGASALSQPQVLRLAPQLEHAGPSQLRELLRPFQRSNTADVAEAFLAAMENARGLTSLAPHEFSDVVKGYPREYLASANRLLDRIRQEEQKKLAQLDKLLPLLKQGRVAAGQKLFFAEKSKCASCHRVGDKGGKIGPDLTTIGSNRAAVDLLESIVFPSATFVRDYEPHSLLTVDGRVLSGLIVRQTSDSLSIQQQTGDPVVVPRADIEELVPSTVSIMPNGLEKALAETELADIISYLMSLKPAK